MSAVDRAVGVAIGLCVVLIAGCGGTATSSSPSFAARAEYECRAVNALQAADAKIPQLDAAVRSGDPHAITLAANAVLLDVMPSAADRSTDSNPADSLDPIVGTALWDVVEAAGDLETVHTAAPAASAAYMSTETALAALAHAHVAIQAAVRERDRLVAAGSLICP